MATMTFTGQNASGFVRYGGVTFPCGKAVSVDSLSPEWLKRLESHPEFVSGSSKKTSAPAPAEKE